MKTKKTKKSNFSIPFYVKKLVEYSSHSIVSKTIAEKRSGSVTVFAFDKGESLSEHSAPLDAIVNIIDGEGLFTIGGKEITVGEGQILIMPANVPHSVKAAKRFKMMLIMI
jgi:quercetin dioxygenase-like cupin family protein